MWQANPEVSVIIPIFNEEENISTLYDTLAESLESMGRTWEAVFIDDGSKDGSLPILRALCARDDRVRVIRLRRNFGQTAALSAGFDHARGQIIITMDGDLQNDPSDIPLLIQKLEDGYDIVSGWRKGRHDHDPFFSKRLPSLISNRIAAWMTGVSIHDSGCTLKAYRKEVLDEIHLYGELHRFIPAMAGALGADVTEIEVKHHPRRKGKSKYGIGRIVRGFLDLIALKFLLSYMTKPMQVFGGLGLLSIFFGFLSGVVAVAMKAFMGFYVTGNPLLYLAILSIIIGVQFISLGFLGEISIRTYHEALRKPIYVVREVLGEGQGIETQLGQPIVTSNFSRS